MQHELAESGKEIDRLYGEIERIKQEFAERSSEHAKYGCLIIFFLLHLYNVFSVSIMAQLLA